MPSLWSSWTLWRPSVHSSLTFSHDRLTDKALELSAVSTSREFGVCTWPAGAVHAHTRLCVAMLKGGGKGGDFLHALGPLQALSMVYRNGRDGKKLASNCPTCTQWSSTFILIKRLLEGRDGRYCKTCIRLLSLVNIAIITIIETGHLKIFNGTKNSSVHVFSQK